MSRASSTMMPPRPSSITSGTEPRRVAMTGVPEAIDSIMTLGCNFPMGPFELLDLVGLDTSLAILDALYDEFRDPNYTAEPALRRMVAAGHLGRKTKRGFREY